MCRPKQDATSGRQSAIEHEQMKREKNGTEARENAEKGD